MTTYRILLMTTAVCSALITAAFINTANSNRLAEPLKTNNPPVWMQMPSTLDGQHLAVDDPLTMAIRICSANQCEYVALNAAQMESFMASTNKTEALNGQYQQSMPFQLPQHGVNVIEM